jgi:hypothetical protein
MNRLFFGLVLVCLALLSACSSSVYKQPVFASTHAQAMPPHKELGKLEKQGCSGIIFFVSWGLGAGPLYQDILEEAQGMGADGVVDFSVASESYSGFYLFPFFYAKECFVAKGTAVRFLAQDGASSWDDPSSLAPDTLETTNKESLWDAPPK